MIFRGWFGHCQEIPRAVRCSPSLFHQSHFDWETERFPVPRVRIGTGCPGRAVGEAFLREGSCHLYFTNRTLTGNESLSPLLTPEADRVATCPLQLRRQTFFTDRTLTGSPNAFPFAAFGYRQPIPQAELSATPSFARCSPS